MEYHVAVMKSREQAEKVLRAVQNAGIEKDRISMLTPAADRGDINRAVATDETEQPGVGPAIGGAIGAAVALGAAAAVFLPGAGAVAAVGIWGMALSGVAGAAAGATLGKLSEDALSHGLPVDELPVYVDALAKGRSLVFVRTDDPGETTTVLGIYRELDAESIDAARHDWWVGLRDAEGLEYAKTGGEWDAVEEEYRRGYAAGLHPERNGASFEQVEDELRRAHPDCYDSDAFRKGFERGTRSGWHDQPVHPIQRK